MVLFPRDRWGRWDIRGWAAPLVSDFQAPSLYHKPWVSGSNKASENLTLTEDSVMLCLREVR